MPVAALIPIAALAVAAAGTAYSVKSAEDQSSAMQDALDATLASQRKYQKTANAAAQQSLEQSGPAVAKKEIGQGAANLENAYKAITSVPVTQPGQQNAPTTSMVPDKGTKVNLQQSNQARAALGGYDEWALQQWIKDLQTQQQLATASTLARLNTSQLPYQLWQAQNSAGTEQMIGQGLTTAGNLGGAIGTAATGGNLFAGLSGAGRGGSLGLTPAQIALGKQDPSWNPGQYTMPSETP